MPFVEYPGYDYRYPAIDTFPISSALASEIKVASEKLYKIFEKVTAVFQSCGDKFLDDMDIPQSMYIAKYCIWLIISLFIFGFNSPSSH